MEAPKLSSRSRTPPQTSNVVHESESQRQHVRVRLPGSIEFEIQSHQRLRFKLYDLSAGGLSFNAPEHQFRVGSSFRGTLSVPLDPLAITIPVTFQVRNLEPKTGRVGCCFQNLGQNEVAALRQLITSFMSGDVVGVGDVLRTVGRPNFTAPRKPAAAAPAGGSATPHATGITLVVFLAGIAAFGYTLQQLHDAIFVARASVAKVSGPVYTIAMPREGTFFSLVPEDGMVKKGAPLASFEAPMIDVLRSQVTSANLTPEMVKKMMSQTIKGTITSPCDCRVQTQYVADAQYVSKSQNLFELVPMDLKNPYILARFRFDQVDDVVEGAMVHFRVSGDSSERAGRVTHVKVQGGEDNTLGTDVIAMVEPLEPLPPELVNRPADVRIGGLGGVRERIASFATAFAGGE